MDPFFCIDEKNYFPTRNNEKSTQISHEQVEISIYNEEHEIESSKQLIVVSNEYLIIHKNLNRILMASKKGKKFFIP